MKDDDAIAALVREGRHEEAAQRAREAGDPLRAAELYAAVWKYEDAMACARAAGALAEAYRHAVLAKDPGAIAALLDELAAVPTEAERAVAIAEDRGRLADAARLARGLGQLEPAARFFERAGELVLAAECRLALGDARAAGMLYERRMKEAPEDAVAALALARILVSLGRHDHAARILSPVVRSDEAALEERRAAMRLSIACFTALGMHDAAADVLATLRESEPSLPASVPEMLRVVFGDSRGLVSEAQRELVLGRYRIVAPLGEGGTGRVLRAEDTFYGREVALKALRAASGAAGRDALARFAREAKVAMGIDHPNVVRVLAYHPEGPYLVMELMEGGTLEDRLGPLDAPNGPLAPSAAFAIARAMLRALEAVHRRGVVHRDLKPANVLFSASGEAKIGDFGVAHLVDLGATMTGAMMGSLATMAPEQISGGKQPGASTDLYAVGIVLYRMLTGAMPFEGRDLAAAHLDETPRAASLLAPWIDARVDALLESLLCKDPEARPGDAAEVRTAIESLPIARYEQAWDERPGRGASRSPSRRPSAPPTSGVEASRYASLRPQLDGSTLAIDTLLEREVEIRPLDDAEHLRAWARLRSPCVQAVCALEVETVVLDRPTAIDGGASRPDLERALADVHAAGLVHGSVDAAHVLVTAAGTMLRVPRGKAQGDADADRAALAALALG